MAEAITFNEYSSLGISTINDMGSAALHGYLKRELEERNLWDDQEVRWSYDFAMALHRNEKRADGVYVDHLARVSLWVVRGFDFNDPEAAKAALLHDAIENHPESIMRELGMGEAVSGTVYDCALDALCRSGRLAEARTCEAIAALTCPSFKGLGPEAKRCSYAQYITSMTLKNPLATVIKIADRIDNANGNKFNPDPKMQRRLDWKYYPLHDLFVEAVMAEESLVPAHRKHAIVTKLQKGHAETRDRLMRSRSGMPGMSEEEVDGLTLQNVLAQKVVA